MIPRSEFALEPDIRYINNASMGVVPLTTAAATKAYVDESTRKSIATAPTAREQIMKDKERIARVIGVRADDIALIKSTTEGARVIADCVDWESGDDVILSDRECLSNVAWLCLRDRGVNVRIVNSPLQRLDAACLTSMITARTKVVAVSWVSAKDGYRHDLATLGTITHKQGSLFLVDGIQGLGAFPLDVAEFPCDALYTGSFKWLMGFRGAGFLYVSDRVLQIAGNRLETYISFWKDTTSLGVAKPELNAPLLQTGGPNGIGVRALASSADFLLSYGLRSISQYVLNLTDRLVAGLQTQGVRIFSIRDGERRSGIVTFAVGNYDQQRFDQYIRDAGIIVGCLGDAIRVSPHAYNTVDEIDEFLDTLRSICAG